METTFLSEYTARKKRNESYLEGYFNSGSLQMIELIKEKKYKGIVVYPEDGHCDEIRTQNIMKVFAHKGYLCFYCLPQKDLFEIKEIEENLIFINNEGYLLPILRSKAVFVLCTCPMQRAWADSLPEKYMMYDLRVPIEKLTCGDETMERYHHELIQQAHYVTYSDSFFSKINKLRVDATFVTDEKNLVEGLEDTIYQHVNKWRLYANWDVTGKIAVMTSSFLDFEGHHFFSGGAERYLTDVSDLCKKKGFELEIYQHGNFPWVRRVKDINVLSLSIGGHDTTVYSLECVKKFNRFFYEQVEGRSLLNIYSAFFEAWPMGASNNIGISHGVAWDHEGCSYQSGLQFWLTNSRFIEGAQACEKLVSVDTNTSNWFQTMDYQLARQIEVIPNYVNLDLFHPRTDFDQSRDKVVILYPRRLYRARGFYMVLEILDEILSRYANVEFHFVGQGHVEDTKHVVEKQKQWKDRVKWYALPMEKMYRAYQNADITLIPTLYSEGTSLSCLEAMASGNAIIATRVGGLTDLVINHYNGLLIDPNVAALQQGIEYLLKDKKLQTQFKTRNVEIAASFSKKGWSQKWTSLIEEKLLWTDKPVTKPTKLIEIYLTSMAEVDEKLGRFICALLQLPSLVYIRVKEMKANKSLSFGRLQWVGWDEERYSNPDLILSLESVAGDLPHEVDLIMNGAWLSQFMQSPQRYFSSLGLEG